MEYDAEQTTIKMLRKHAVFKDQAVLEIGCGGGETASILAGDTQHYIGIDPDENRIREPKKSITPWTSGLAMENAWRLKMLVLILCCLHCHCIIRTALPH